MVDDARGTLGLANGSLRTTYTSALENTRICDMTILEILQWVLIILLLTPKVTQFVKDFKEEEK
jgi:hypothetical protein